jgi:hypothetical protein
MITVRCCGAASTGESYRWIAASAFVASASSKPPGKSLTRRGSIAMLRCEAAGPQILRQHRLAPTICRSFIFIAAMVACLQAIVVASANIPGRISRVLIRMAAFCLATLRPMREAAVMAPCPRCSPKLQVLQPNCGCLR